MPNSSEPNNSFSSVVTLASWRVRRTWFLLLVTTLGMVTAVVIACAVPLFVTVTTTAGLRNTLNAQPTSSEMRLDTNTLGASTRLVSDVQQLFDPLFQRNLGTVLQQPTQFILNIGNFAIASPRLQTKTSALVTYATSIRQATPYLTMVQGRLPHKTNNAAQIEIILTPETAQSFGVGLGSTMKLNLTYFLRVPDTTQQDYTKDAKQAVVIARVVGLFTVDQSHLAYWHDTDFNPFTENSGGAANQKTQVYSILTSDTNLLSFLDSVAAQQHISAPIMENVELTWYYHLDASRISITQLDMLIHNIAAIKTTIDTQYAPLENYNGFNADTFSYPYLGNLNLYSPLFPDVGDPGSLGQFQSRATVARIPATIISLQILVLILFFVSLMTDLLVDRQADALMVLRSRGASRGQIFGALMTQSVGLGLVAIVIGLPLTFVVVVVVSQRILPTQVQDALNVITNNPLQALQNVLGYAAAVVLVVLITMGVSLLRVVRMDILSMRREATRSTRRPLWQRLHLDIAAGVLALLGYGVTLYLTTIGSLLNDTIKAISSALFSLISPYFLIVVFLLLFLRFFPLVLRLGAWLTGRGRSAASMLALAQMSRSPRQSLRMTTLLALTITFALFSLIFFASQEQRINDLAAFQTGADFSGTLPENIYIASPQQAETQYRAIKGVTSASAGFVGTGTISNTDVALTLALRGIDTNTYVQTAIWPTQASTQSLPSLIALLTTKRQYGINTGVVPVIVDETTSGKLALHLGSSFLINRDGASLAPDMHCVVVGIVAHIPTIDTTPAVGTSTFYAPTGGVLFDYQTYNAIYMKQVQDANKGRDTLSINWLLLRTQNDANSLVSVRAALNSLELHLFELSDRRALIDALHIDPLTLTLEGILSLGTVATLLLAILGDLLASWSSAHTRLTNFAVLRALGTSPRQVASVLTWEQGLIYGIGLLLGLAFGVLLATTVVPTLIYYGLSIQSTLPVQIIVPISLILTLGAVIVVFVIALSMMVRTVSSPSMSQTLRLNED